MQTEAEGATRRVSRFFGDNVSQAGGAVNKFLPASQVFSFIDNSKARVSGLFS